MLVGTTDTPGYEWSVRPAKLVGIDIKFSNSMKPDVLPLPRQHLIQNQVI
jgi:hypothetical protein